MQFNVSIVKTEEDGVIIKNDHFVCHVYDPQTFSKFTELIFSSLVKDAQDKGRLKEL